MANENFILANDAVGYNYDKLESAFGAENMPPRLSDTFWKILNCGHHGCVFKTYTKGKVFKLTDDGTEAAFVAFLLNNKMKLDGFVEYHKVVMMPRCKPFNKTIYAILRQEVDCAGIEKIMKSCLRDKKQREYIDYLREFIFNLKDYCETFQELTMNFKNRLQLTASAFKNHKNIYSQEIQNVFSIIADKPERYEIDYKLTVLLATIRDLFYTYLKPPFSYYAGPLAVSMLKLLDMGILLGDVHEGNVGYIKKSGEIVVFDPGHAVALIKNRLQQEIEIL
jgi:hypothetical protein